MKHVLLTRILAHLSLKPAPFRVIDTHAGIGRYELAGPEASRTAEWREGVGRMDENFSPEVEQLLAPYRTVLADTAARYGRGTYPGSPAIIREMLRPGDRAILVEKHPDDHALLADRFNAVATTKVVRLDGWTALGGFVPPKERRGLVFVDPPYEEPGELARAGERLAGTLQRWPTGIYALWYPIKDLAEVSRFTDRIARQIERPGLRLEIVIDDPALSGRLVGSGLVVVNPPWTLAEDAGLILPELAQRLARKGRGAHRCGPLS